MKNKHDTNGIMEYVFSGKFVGLNRGIYELIDFFTQRKL